MGMFSWDCLACGFSLRDCRGCSEKNWMAHGVCVTPDGSRVIGFYNSYGQLGEYNLVDQIGKFGIYHKACWELLGKPEYTKPASQSRDQGFCHQLHGQPFAAPTVEWIEKAKTWQYVDRTINAYWHLRAELDFAEVQKTWDSLTPERQLALCNAYEADKVARRTRNHDRQQAYYNDPDENAVEPAKEEDPDFFKFDDRNFDYGWLGVLVTRAAYDR